MTKTIKLSPAMQKMLWRMFNQTWIANENLPTDLRHRGSNESATRLALRDRGMVEYVRYDLETGEPPHYRITEAGHAWIAEQIEIAHEEATFDVRQLTDESNQRMRWHRLHDKCIHAGLWAAIECDHANALRANIGLSRSGSDQDRAIREAQRANCVAVSLPALLDDWTEALLEDIDRGGKAWKGMPLTRI